MKSRAVKSNCKEQRNLSQVYQMNRLDGLRTLRKWSKTVL